jgi:mono/diheme cytochrome c family protein
MTQPSQPQEPARRRSPLRAVAAGVLILVFVVGGLLARSEIQKRRDREVAEGKRLFQLSCCGCHGGKISDVAKVPPNLAGVFSRRSLPSGAPATDAQVRATILGGRANIMPSFQDVLTDDQIDDIIRYLHTIGPEARLCASN